MYIDKSIDYTIDIQTYTHNDMPKKNQWTHTNTQIHKLYTLL